MGSRPWGANSWRMLRYAIVSLYPSRSTRHLPLFSLSLTRLPLLFIAGITPEHIAHLSSQLRDHKK
jgi:hypothetical protein